MDTVNQSLAGRTAILKLLPLSISEIYTGESSKVHSIPELIYRGFYPRIVAQNLDPAQAYSFYVSTYLERDLRQLKEINNLGRFETFLTLCAANVGQLVNFTRIANDCGITEKTAASWMSILQASYIIFLLQPHHNNLRKRVTKSPKLYFYDVGLAAHLLKIQSADHASSHPLLGSLFENMMIHDLIKQAWNRARDHHLSFFRDHSGNEVDVISDFGTGVRTIEIKLSQTVSSSQFKGLRKYNDIRTTAQEKQASVPATDLATINEQYLIYGGTDNHTRNNVEVVSYRQFAHTNPMQWGGNSLLTV